MSSLSQDYFDLIASGDKQKIHCVLLAAGAGSITGGLAAGTYFAPANIAPGVGQTLNATAAGIGAVLGGLLAAKAAYKTCGGESTRGGFDRLFETGKIDSFSLNGYEASLRKEFNLSASEARAIAKAAYVYNLNATNPVPDATPVERRNAVGFLLKKLGDEGLA